MKETIDRYYMTTYSSPIGILTLVSDGTRLNRLWMEQQQCLPPEPCCAVSIGDDPVLARTGQWLDAYFSGRMPSIGMLPLEPAGTPFRRLIWHILCEIPYGHVRTYGDIAREAAGKLGKTHMAAQAVGGAVGHNPIAIIIPCHRVVGANGSLTGYAGGIENKIALLDHEGINMTKFTACRKY